MSGAKTRFLGKALPVSSPSLRVLPHGTSPVLLVLYQMSDGFQKPGGDETHPWASPRLHLPLRSVCSGLKQGRQRVCLMVCLLKRDLLRVCVHKCVWARVHSYMWRPEDKLGCSSGAIHLIFKDGIFH